MRGFASGSCQLAFHPLCRRFASPFPPQGGKGWFSAVRYWPQPALSPAERGMMSQFAERTRTEGVARWLSNLRNQGRRHAQRAGDEGVRQRAATKSARCVPRALVPHELVWYEVLVE